MKVKTYLFEVDNKTYEIPVTYKFQRGLYLRAKKDGFVASAPSLLSEAKVQKFIQESLPTLIKRVNKKVNVEQPIGENYTYLFGEKVEGIIQEKELRKIALEEFTNQTRECEQLMGIKKPYKVHVRKMKSRYGSNSRTTHSLNYQLNLVHFDKEIIRSVVVHELAHEYHRNHQKGFYDCLLQYCPNYKTLRSKLIKGVYK